MKLKEIKQQVKKKLHLEKVKDIKKYIWQKWGLELDLRKKASWEKILSHLDVKALSASNDLEKQLIYNTDGSGRCYRGYHERCSNQSVLHVLGTTLWDYPLKTIEDVTKFCLQEIDSFKCKRWFKGKKHGDKKPTVNQLVKEFDNRSDVNRAIIYVNGHAIGYNKNRKTRLLDTAGKGFSRKRVFYIQVID